MKAKPAGFCIHICRAYLSEKNEKARLKNLQTLASYLHTLALVCITLAHACKYLHILAF